MVDLRKAAKISVDLRLKFDGSRKLIMQVASGTWEPWISRFGADIVLESVGKRDNANGETNTTNSSPKLSSVARFLQP